MSNLAQKQRQLRNIDGSRMFIKNSVRIATFGNLVSTLERLSERVRGWCFRGVRDMVRGDGQIGGSLRGWLNGSVRVMRDFQVAG